MTLGLDDATVAVSEFTEREHTGGAHRYPDQGDQWTTIYNAVDVEGIHDAAIDGPSARDTIGLTDEPLFVNIGRYIPSKEQERLIYAMSSLVREHPNAHLAIVGWGPREDDLRESVARLDLTENVTITGRVDAVEPYLGAADAFVLSSRAESFGIVLAEAMAAELPIIALDSPAAREVIGPNCGQIVNADSDTLDVALAGTMAEELNISDEQRVERGRAGYQRAQELFGIETCAESYLDLYRSLTQSNISP